MFRSETPSNLMKKQWTKPGWLATLGLILAFGMGACVPMESGGGDPPLFPTMTTAPRFSTPEPTASLYPLSVPAPTDTAITPGDPSPTATAIAIATFTPTPLACWAQGGKIQKGQLPTDLLPSPLEYRLYLPPCFDQQAERRYPVLYLIHGQTYTDEQWDRLGVDETANALIAAGDAPPFLIVMPRDRSWAWPKEDKFGEAVIQVLLPWIDENYPTRPDRAQRAIGGLSRGAGWAVHLGLSHWEDFGAIGAHSPAIFNSDAPGHITEWLAAIPNDSMPRIYIDLGDHDRQEITKAAEWFEALLTQLGIPHEWHLNVGRHEEAYWRTHIEDYLRWYTAGW